MTDQARLDFERRFERRLAHYADIDVTEVDAEAVARTVVRTGRPKPVTRYLLAVAALLVGAGALGGAALLGGQPVTDRTTSDHRIEPRPSAAITIPTHSPRPTLTAAPTATPGQEPMMPIAEPLLGFEIAVPAAWIHVASPGALRPRAPGVRVYGPVQVSVGTPDGALVLCDTACRDVTGATSIEALERAAGETAGLRMTASTGTNLGGESGSEIRVTLSGAADATILRRLLAIHRGRPVVVDFDMSDGRVSGELRARIRDSFHFLRTSPDTTAYVAPDGSYAIDLTERWHRHDDVGNTMVFGDRGQVLTIAAADAKGQIPTCLESAGAWETCQPVRVASLEQLDVAIQPSFRSDHGAGPMIARDVTALGDEPAVVYQVEAYEYPAHGAQWITYVAAMHGGRPYIMRVWTGMESGIQGLEELLAGFRFLD